MSKSNIEVGKSYRICDCMRDKKLARTYDCYTFVDNLICSKVYTIHNEQDRDRFTSVIDQLNQLPGEKFEAREVEGFTLQSEQSEYVS